MQNHRSTPPVGEVAPTLDADGIEAALQFIEESWEPAMLPAEREEWSDALAYMRPGELKPVIERWSAPRRPTGSAVLDYILTNRGKRPFVKPEPHEPDLGGRYTPVVVDSIKTARDALARRLERDLVSCSPDHP